MDTFSCIKNAAHGHAKGLQPNLGKHVYVQAVEPKAVLQWHPMDFGRLFRIILRLRMFVVYVVGQVITSE